MPVLSAISGQVLQAATQSAFVVQAMETFGVQAPVEAAVQMSAEAAGTNAPNANARTIAVAKPKTWSDQREGCDAMFIRSIENYGVPAPAFASFVNGQHRKFGSWLCKLHKPAWGLQPSAATFAVISAALSPGMYRQSNPWSPN